MRVIDQMKRLVIAVRPNHTCNRREHFFPVYAPVIAGSGNNRGCHVIAIRVPIDPLTAADYLAALSPGQLHIGHVFIKLALADNRTNLGTLYQCIVDYHRSRTSGQFLDKLIVNCAMHNQA